VVVVVTVCPESVVNDGCGLNPLFVAIRFNADVEVVRCLVTAYPSCTSTRDRGNGLPLRRAIENQSPVETLACLCTSPEVVLDADAYVHNTALHGALECGTAREATVELMVQTAPEIALTRSKSGQTPLNLASQRWQRVRSHRRRDEKHLGHVWRMVQCLMRAAFYGKFQGNILGAPTLHAALSLQMPLDIVLFALECCKDESRVKDPQGRYALQLAIENCLPLDYPISLPMVEAHLTQKEVKILKVLEQCPEVASLPNADGRTALSLAAGANSVSELVLQNLWQVDPTALRRMDSFFRLYPFQVAALAKGPLPMITSERAAEQWREAEDMLHLSSIYTLLRQAPDLIQLTAKNDGR
jgi:ankyrin repeat protein